MNRRHVLARAGALTPLVATLAALAACSKTDPAPAASGASPAAPQATTAAASAAPAEGSGAITPARALELAATGNGFTVGPMMAANTVYIFFDTQCPHCAALWQASTEVRSKFKMQWMPVAFMAKISQPQGAAIITAKDPAALMTENETLLMQRKGGLDVTTLQPSAEAMAKVAANTELLKQLGADSVPMIYFKNQRTGQPGSHSGAMPAAALVEMVGA
ncbi:hypothetical protein BH09PSE5_BH09PSE5_37050 [soil metagenome]